MLEKHRQQLIIDILDQIRYASVPYLTEKLNSSEATIRRDIRKMATRGEIIKIRGGAEAIDGGVKKKHIASSVFFADKEKGADVKRLIAQRAVELCSDGSFIAINGGSSTFMMGEFLADKQLNILTNSFVLAGQITETTNNQVSLAGGEIYREQGIILSSYDNDGIENYHSEYMFMGTPGICDFGVMENDPLLIRSEQKLKKQSEKLVVLADSTKIGKRSNFIFCPLNEVDILITDSNADREVLRSFESKGVQVIIVEVPTKAE